MKTGIKKIENLTKLTTKVKGKKTHIMDSKFTIKEGSNDRQLIEKELGKELEKRNIGKKKYLMNVLAMIKSEALKEGNLSKEFNTQQGCSGQEAKALVDVSAEKKVMVKKVQKDEVKVKNRAKQTRIKLQRLSRSAVLRRKPIDLFPRLPSLPLLPLAPPASASLPKKSTTTSGTTTTPSSTTCQPPITDWWGWPPYTLHTAH